VETLRAIQERHSTGRLAEPAPTAEQLDTLLGAADHAPDHKRLKPWRFIVLHGERKAALSETMVSSLLLRDPGAGEAALAKERGKLDRAPLVIAVATARLDTPLPFEELLAATAAAIQNLLLAATDLGLGSMWRTGDSAYDPVVKAALGLQAQDFISGFIYLGTKPDSTAT
jgi:nitroreductase